MAKRRARTHTRYVTPPEAPHSSPFSLDRVLSWIIPFALAALVALTGFYYTTNATVQQQSEQIKQLIAQSEKTNGKVESVSKSVTEKTDSDNSAREKIREAFLASQNETTRGIAKLDTRLAVAEKQQEVANAQLQKISDSLERISNLATGAVGRK